MRGLEGKRIVVAGGAGGIGGATAKRLSQEGAKVVVGDVNLQGAQEMEKQIVSTGGQAAAFQFDLADEKSIISLIQFSVEKYGGIDGLVNVGADLSKETIGRDTGILDMLPEVWRRTLEVNLVGFALTSKAAIPHFLSQGGGAIVNVSSGTVYAGQDSRPAYAASKAGIQTLTRHTARTWGKDNIRANCIAPGLVVTEKARATLPKAALEEEAQLTALRRLGTPEDPAALITFLLSDDSSWMTNQVISIDGGRQY